MENLIILIIAISLSLDAFSLSLAYGTLDLTKKDIHKLSIIVSIYHFLMPQIGNYLGKFIIKVVNPNIVVLIVLCFIGSQMIIENEKYCKIKIMKNIELLFFGLAVSIDSFSSGIGLSSICKNILFSSFLFAVSAYTFTCTGLMLGKKINHKIGRISTTIGGITLIIIGLLYGIKI